MVHSCQRLQDAADDEGVVAVKPVRQACRVALAVKNVANDRRQVAPVVGLCYLLQSLVYRSFCFHAALTRCHDRLRDGLYPAGQLRPRPGKRGKALLLPAAPAARLVRAAPALGDDGKGSVGLPDPGRGVVERLADLLCPTGVGLRLGQQIAVGKGGGAGGGQTAVLAWVGGCGLSLALPMLAGAVALRVFRDIATPLADVVAQGDLSVQVPVPLHGPKAFRRLAESFNHMTEELERADRRRRNLTADVAHELRTPLHVIQGNLEGVLDGVYEPAAEHIGATLDETRTLARPVDDLRTLSLAEAGQLPLTWEPVDVIELLADVGTSFSGQAEAAGIDLRVGPVLSTVACTEPGRSACTEPGRSKGPVLSPQSLGLSPGSLSPRIKETRGTVEGTTGGSLANGVTIIADVGRLDQVLGNLMANALRHTPPGGAITLRAESIRDGVRIIVRDTGVGIPAEDLPYIFDRFWRGDRSRSHAGGAGSGLGLAIARQLVPRAGTVQAHGGRIGVESEPGQGTTFTIELPASRNHE